MEHEVQSKIEKKKEKLVLSRARNADMKIYWTGKCSHMLEDEALKKSLKAWNADLKVGRSAERLKPPDGPRNLKD